ncbi:MAG: FAD:protein FMN transferase [Clostridiales bacterium]|nr:FAD:protein FMN transferase [Clostridiales bacterium]
MKKLLINKKTAVLAAAVFFLISSLAGCARNRTISKTALKLDTVVTITIYGSSDPAPIDSAFDEIDRLAALLDVNDKGSDLYRLAENAGKWVEVADETAEVLALAQRYYELSGGYFDITAAPLVELWNVNNGGYFPTDEEIKAALAIVDGAALLLDGNMACLEREGMKADLGGIAKGYIADKVKTHLISLGIDSAVIDLGGNVLLIGGKPDGSAFNIGIKDPLSESGELLKTVRSSGESLVTSGIYERYFEHEGKRYHHILDPFTGAPSESDVAGVTIISTDSVHGDALSTSCLLLGREAGMELVESIDGAEALFVTRDGNLYMTSGMAERIK